MSQQGTPFLANSYTHTHTHTHTYTQNAQSPGARTPRRINYLQWCLIFVGCQNGTGFISALQCLEFWRSPKISGKFVLPCKLYTGWNRRNVPNFGSVFLMLNYTKKTQNTYIQSWTVWEIMASEVWNFDSCYTLTDYQIHIESGRNMWFL